MTNFTRIWARSAAVAVGVLLVTGIPIATTSATAVAPHVASVPTSTASGYAWLNYYRSIAGLPGLSRNAGIEAQEALHVRYLADHALACETNVHDELTTRVGNCGANPFATAAGKAAANNSNVTRVSGRVPDQTAVSNWFVSAFHALTLLDPRLASTGYAAYYTASPKGAKPLAWNFTAAVDVYRGRSAGYNGHVVAFPGNLSSSPLLAYQVGTESPEPFRTTMSTSACHSWGTRTFVSAPIVVQWPRATAGAGAAGRIVDLTSSTVLPTCSLNAGSYPVGSLPRSFLDGTNGITRTGLYYAATPFAVGHRYQLQIGGRAVTTFTAVSNQPAAPAVHVASPVRSADLGLVGAARRRPFAPRPPHRP